MWTVLVNDDNAEKYYFEIDLFLPNIPSKRIVYRYLSLMFIYLVFNCVFFVTRLS